MEPFKNEFSYSNAMRISARLEEISPDFSAVRFRKGLEKELEPLELKQRMHLIADRIAEALPLAPPEQFAVLVKALAADGDEKLGLRGFILWPFTELVARRGAGHFDEAMDALREMTKRFTGEFAIRPFLLADRERTLTRMDEWCADPNEHVRRLVSEGSRPLLPWGVRLPELMAEPRHGLALLEKLYADPSEYVRLSVSNHLNDFSKVHPELVLETLQRWRKKHPDSPELAKLSRHACRTLVKQGHPGALAFHGYGEAEALLIECFSLPEDSVEIGGSLPYVLRIRNASERKQRLLFDYAIHHRKANGGLSPKVFKGRIRDLEPGEVCEISGKHSLKRVTTRTYHPGVHRFEPRINGSIRPALDFMLTAG